MINIAIIPTIREQNKNQLEACVDLRLIEFIKKTFSRKKTKFFFSIERNINLVILTGGNDLASIKKNRKNILRDRLNQKALNYAEQKNIPIVGYCGGAQYLAFKFNSKISYSNKHVGNHGLYTKKNNFFKNLLFPKITNSYHKYKIHRLGQNLQEICIAPDKSVEFFIHKKKRIYGIMWHPERKRRIINFDKKLLKKISCI